MTSRAASSKNASIPFCLLPWVLAAVFFIIYLVTLNHGPGLQTIGVTAKVTGWDWTPALQFPLYFLITLPVTVLPATIQVLALNFLSAVMGALTIGLLVRSVQLLPQDRTRDQRERERSEKGLLTGPGAWLPGVAAAIVCGFQLLFWQSATNASNDLLNVLLLAWIIRELLEFRQDNRERRLVLVAFLYGAGVTNNAALIALFPFALGSIIWILGMRFFRSALILKLTAAGIAGLLFYLVLPMVAVSSDVSGLTFWEALKTNMGAQKGVLSIGWNNRLFPMLMCLGSLFPIIFIGIRWPSSFGDTSAAGSWLTQRAFRMMVVLFIPAAVMMNLQMPHAAKAQSETGFGFYSLYYLSAIVIGYSIAYLLVVYGKSPEKKWQKSTGAMALVNKAMVGVAYAFPVVMLVLLLKEGYPKIRAYNHSDLNEYIRNVAAQLPEEPSLVLSDDVALIYLVAAELDRTGASGKHWLIQTASLNFPAYHKILHERFGDEWPEVPQDMIFENDVEDGYILRTVLTAGKDRPIRYLHPSYGYYFERLYPVENGFLYNMERYPTNVVQAPPLEPDRIRSQNELLQEYWDRSMDTLVGKLERGTASLAEGYLASIRSRALNAWGVHLQHNNLFKEAAPFFERAIQLSTNNVSALINAEYNRWHQSERTNDFKVSESTVTVLNNYRDNIQLVLSLNGPIDTPEFCMAFGQVFAAGKLPRQSAQQFLRAMTLVPDNNLARVQLVRTFLGAQAPDKALEMLQEIRRLTADSGLNEYAQIDLMSLEATALFTKKQPDKAVEIIETLRNRFPNNEALLSVSATLYLSFAPYFSDLVPRAEKAVQAQMNLAPTNALVRFNTATIAFLKKDWTLADALFTEVLEADKTIQNARFNRAMARLQAGRLNEALEDYEMLHKESPNAYQLNYGLGQIADKQSRREDAIRYFTEYLRTAPRNSAEYTNVTERLQALQKP